MLDPGYEVQFKTRPGAVTPVAVHLLLPQVQGAPGLGVALVDTQRPAITTTDYFPGTDTGNAVARALDQGGAAVNFGDVNDPNDDTDFAQTDGLVSANDYLRLQFRGNNAGALAGRRILGVQIMGLFMNR